MFQVLAKWGEYSNDVQFILQRSPLDPVSKSPSSPSPGQETKGPGYPGMKKSPTFPGTLPPSNQAAIWKSPPGVMSSKPVVSASSGRLSELASASRHLSPEVSARLSPDSGRGSDPTGSDTSNFSDQEKARGRGQGGPGARSSQGPVSGYTPPGWAGLRAGARFTSPSPDRGPEYGYSQARQGAGPSLPPAYRPPPPALRNSSPASVSDPPPYREPPPPPPGARGPASPHPGRHVSGLPQVSSPPVVRAPHYSPPPHHRELRGHKGPSPGRSVASQGQAGVRGVSASPSRGQASPSRSWSQGPGGPSHQWSAQQPRYPQVSAHWRPIRRHLSIKVVTVIMNVE